MSETPDNLTSVTTQLGEQPAGTPPVGAWPPPPQEGTNPSPAPLARPRFRPILGVARAAPVLILLNCACNLAYNVSRLTGQTAAAVYLIWVYRTYANLHALGARSVRTTPGAAVGYYFIPIIAFFLPYQNMDEVWKASEYGAVAKGWPDPEYQGRSLRIMAWWWILWVVWSIADRICQFAFRGDTSNPAALEVNTACAGLGVVCGILAVAVIYRVTARQLATHRRMLDEDSQ